MKQWLKNGATLCIALVLGLILAEICLRVLGVSYPLFYTYDPHLGGRLRSGVSGYWLQEGGGYVSINSDGLRDREHSISKPPNTLRIAVLGDSYAEAMQVDREKAFWAILENLLQQCETRGRTIEVINFGQSGFGTSQELTALRQRAWKYSPDVVLLAFLTGNDVMDNSRELKKQDYHPYHVYRDGKLVLDDSITKKTYAERYTWGGEFRDSLINRCALWQLARHVHASVAKRATAAQPKKVGDEPGLPNKIYSEPNDEVWKQAWRVTEDVLVMMRDDVAAAGAKFFVVILSNGIQVHPDPAVRTGFAEEIGVPDLFYPDRRVEAFCRSHGIDVFALAPVLQAYAQENKVVLHGFGSNLGSGHWNESGHRTAAENIARWLCPSLNNLGARDEQRSGTGPK